MRRSVVIVDDHEQFRRSARKLLVLEGFDVVGEASDGAGGVTVVERLRPDVVLLDVGLPDVSGFQLVRRLTATSTVVLVSSRDPAEWVARTKRAGARGFISKDRLSGAALTALLDGEPR